MAIRMQSNRTVQRDNTVVGDIVGRDKIVHIKKELIPKQLEPIRTELDDEYDLLTDADGTTLLKKLKDGQVNVQMRNRAVLRKTKALTILMKMCQTQHGRAIVADLFDSLMTMVENKYLINMDDGDLLKTNMEHIHEDFAPIIEQYSELIQVDQPILTGMLYIATSNCALKWKVEDAS